MFYTTSCCPHSRYNFWTKKCLCFDFVFIFTQLFIFVSSSCRLLRLQTSPPRGMMAWPSVHWSTISTQSLSTSRPSTLNRDEKTLNLPLILQSKLLFLAGFFERKKKVFFQSGIICIKVSVSSNKDNSLMQTNNQGFTIGPLFPSKPS